MEEIELYLQEAEESMKKAIDHTSKEFTKIRAGKASPAMLQGLMVNYYETMTPIDQVASVTTPDARTIMIKPWEKSIIREIETAIINSDLGFNPSSDSDFIRINVPALTEERRKDLVKQAKSEAENGKIRIRGVRKDINAELKKLQKDGTAEDAIKAAEDSVQNLTDSSIKKIDSIFAIKEEEIMTV